MTRSTVIKFFAASLILFAGAGLAMVGQAMGRAEAERLAPPTPVIALVDLPKVFEQLDERKAREEELIKSAEAKQAELTQLAKEIEDEGKMAQAMADLNTKQNAIVKLLEKQAMATAKRNAYDALLDQQRAQVFLTLYGKVADAAKRMAESRGYTIVMANDQNINTQPGAGTNEVRQTLGQRRVLFAAQSHDITSELITQLNLENKSGRR